MLGSPQLSPLQANFYLKMRRRLAAIKEGSETGKYRREDYEKLKAHLLRPHRATAQQAALDELLGQPADHRATR